MRKAVSPRRTDASVMPPTKLAKTHSQWTRRCTAELPHSTVNRPTSVTKATRKRVNALYMSPDGSIGFTDSPSSVGRLLERKYGKRSNRVRNKFWRALRAMSVGQQQVRCQQALATTARNALSVRVGAT